MQYNHLLITRFNEKHEKTKNIDQLVMDELDLSTKCMFEDLVHPRGDLS